MISRSRIILFFGGLALLGASVLFAVTYISVQDYEVYKGQNALKVFSQHLSYMFVKQSTDQERIETRLTRLAQTLPNDYFSVLLLGNQHLLPDTTAPKWASTALATLDLKQLYINQPGKDNQPGDHDHSSQDHFILSTVPVPGTAARLLLLQRTKHSTWRDFKEFFLLPIVITGLASIWAAIWLAIIISSLYKKLEEKNIILAQQNKTIEDALEKLNGVNKAKSLFLANMSHEIRTPLTAIIGFADTSLDHTATDADRLDAMQTIRRSGEHLLHLINDILDISKVEANKLKMESIKVNYFELIQDVETVFQQQAHSKGLKFSVHYHFPLPQSITTDPHRLRQIIFNLCSNAIKFTQQGHVYLDIRCDITQQETCISIIDTGMGISQEQQGKIFDTFAQADSSTTRQFGGTGLGLSLSQQLAKCLGGSLTVSSESGQGSCFILCIATGPLADVRMIDDADSVPAPQKPAPVGTTPEPIHAHILVAEDNPDNQRLITIYLKKMGADVTVVENGLLALEHAKKHPADLILLDIQMPVMDGFETLSRMRAQGCVMPIIALTANALEEEKRQCKDVGFDDFIVKPIQRDIFYTTLHRHLVPVPANNADAVENDTAPITSRLLEEDPDFAKAVAYFVNDLPGRMKLIIDAYQKNDQQDFKSLIHQLKGSAGGVGYPMLTQVAIDIETCLMENHREAIEPLLDNLKNYTDRIIAGHQSDHLIATQAHRS